MKLGADRWQQYRLRFDVPEGKLTVTVGPVVDTGQNVLVAEPARPRSATAELPCRLRLDYESETVIDIFDGPVFSMQPHSEGYVVPVFIPWHRSWSHSILVGLAGALIAGLVWGPRAAAVAAAAQAAHVFEDQLGYMGNNLFYPFRKRRVPGLALTHSGATAANLAAVWLCCLLILWNLARAARPPVPGLTLAHLLLYAFILPGAMLMLARRVLAKTSRRPDVRTAGGVDGDSRAT